MNFLGSHNDLSFGKVDTIRRSHAIDQFANHLNFKIPCFGSQGSVPKLLGLISGDIILFVSAQQRRIEARNCVVVFIFIPFSPYEKSIFIE